MQSTTERKLKEEFLRRTKGEWDEKDWILLQALQEYARHPFAELARRADLSPPAAAERVRRLEDLGLITGYHAAVDPARLGLNIQVLIEIHVPRSGYDRFQQDIKALPFILECHHLTGKAAFLLKAAVPSVEVLDTLIGHLSQFGDTTTSLVLSTPLERRIFRQL